MEERHEKENHVRNMQSDNNGIDFARFVDHWLAMPINGPADK